MNKFFDDSRDSSTKTAKWKAVAKTTKERINKLSAKVDGAIKRANSSEAALKRVAT